MPLRAVDALGARPAVRLCFARFDAALPAAWWAPQIGVLDAMPAGALGCQVRQLAAANVLFVRDGFQVGGVVAFPIAAKVIYD